MNTNLLYPNATLVTPKVHCDSTCTSSLLALKANAGYDTYIMIHMYGSSYIAIQS